MGMEKLDQDQLVLKLNILRGIDLRDLERVQLSLLLFALLLAPLRLK